MNKPLVRYGIHVIVALIGFLLITQVDFLPVQIIGGIMALVSLGMLFYPNGIDRG